MFEKISINSVFLLHDPPQPHGHSEQGLHQHQRTYCRHDVSVGEVHQPIPRCLREPTFPEYRQGVTPTETPSIALQICAAHEYGMPHDCLAGIYAALPFIQGGTIDAVIHAERIPQSFWVASHVAGGLAGMPQVEVRHVGHEANSLRLGSVLHHKVYILEPHIFLEENTQSQEMTPTVHIRPWSPGHGNPLQELNARHHPLVQVQRTILPDGMCRHLRPVTIVEHDGVESRILPRLVEQRAQPPWHEFVIVIDEQQPVALRLLDGCVARATLPLVHLVPDNP